MQQELNELLLSGYCPLANIHSFTCNMRHTNTVMSQDCVHLQGNGW